MATIGSYIPGLIATGARIINGNNPDFESYFSGQSRIGSPIKRMEFVYKDTSFKFKINPEEYTQSEPNRVNITQTKGGAWLDAWGGGIIEITIKGTTGVTGGKTLLDIAAKTLIGQTLKDIDQGYRKFKELRKLFRQIYDDAKDGEEIQELLKFYNYTDNEFYLCYPKPEGITLYRSKSRPNIYQYYIGLYALRRIGEPEKTTITMGNPTKPTPKTTTPTPVETSGNPQKTSSSQTSQYTGGKSKSVSKINTLSEADSYTYTTTKTKPNAYIIEDAKTYVEELSGIIGGKNGRISPTTGYQVCSGISMQETGFISNVRGFKCIDINPEATILHKTSQYIPKCSLLAYNMYKGIKEYSDEYLSTEYISTSGSDNKQRIAHAITVGTELDSTLFEHARNCRIKGILTKENFNRIKIILIESMVVYQDIYQISKKNNVYESISSEISVSQIKRIIDNSESMNFYLKEIADERTKLEYLDICGDLRKLCKVMTQINSDIINFM